MRAVLLILCVFSISFGFITGHPPEINNSTDFPPPQEVSTLPQEVTSDQPDTTTVPPTTSSTTPVPTTTPTTPTSTTTKPSSTTTKPSSTTVPTTQKPTIKPTVQPSTTETPHPTPEPAKGRHFDGPSFFGGIILAVGLMAIGLVVLKFYKARAERNYHTL